MADFRKWFPVLAVVALILGATMSASAQTPALSCNTNAGVPPLLRAEGMTELTGDIILNCTGGSGGQFLINVQIFLNTNITSRILTGNPGSSTPVAQQGKTEALLLINEPAVPALGTSAFLGSKAADNSVVWLGVPFTPPGSTGVTVIRITNVRANASAFAGSAGSLIPQSIDCYISISGSQSVPVNNPKQTVGYVQTGLTFAVVRCSDFSSSPSTTSTSTGNKVSYRQCSAENSTPYSDITSTLTNQFALKYTEAFATAFKQQIQLSPSQDPSTPGAVYNTESGYVNSTQLGNEVGFANNGTRFMATFTNVPAGVKIFVATLNAGAGVTQGARKYPTAWLVSGSDANGAGGYPAAGYTQAGDCAGYTAGDTNITPNIPKGTAPVMVPLVAAVDGSMTAVWEVQTSDATSADNYVFAVAVAYKVDIPNGIPGLTSARVPVNGQLAPNYQSPTGTTMSSTLPVPRFLTGGKSVNTFSIDPCMTNLLFPFVTNQAGFDTGIAISNTNNDPFGTKPQAGVCTINYYSNPAPAMTSEVSSSIPSGGTLTFTLSSGNSAQNIKGNPGFQGYIIAQCKFQNGHGFGFITDLGATRLAEGYLALILDGTTTRGTNPVAGEALNN